MEALNILSIFEWGLVVTGFVAGHVFGSGFTYLIIKTKSRKHIETRLEKVKNDDVKENVN